MADNLFWLGRYAERVEHSVRLLRSVVVRLADEDATDAAPPERTALVRVLVSLELLPASPFATRCRPATWSTSCWSSLFKQSPGCPHAGDARRAAANRSRTSGTVSLIDTWRILNQLRQDFRLRHGRLQLDDALLHLNRMITDLAAFSGMEMKNMTRGHGWRFLDIGRRLERAANVTVLLT